MYIRNYLAIIASLCVWSTWGLAVRWLGAPALVLTFYNGLFSLCFQTALLIKAGRREDLHPGRDIGPLVFLGFCGLINVLSYFYALKATSIATAVLTHYTAPIFVALFAPFMLKERMSRHTAVALAVSVGGLGMVVAGASSGDGLGIPGAAAGTLSGLAYGFLIILSRQLAGRHNPVKLPFVQSLVTVVCLAPVVMVTDGLSLTLYQALGLIVVGVLHSTLAIVWYLYGVRVVTAQEAGVLGYLEPVFGIMLAYFFLSETPGVTAIGGGALILLSGAIVVYNGKRAEVKA